MRQEAFLMREHQVEAAIRLNLLQPFLMRERVIVIHLKLKENKSHF